jgi:hypothetical protein
MGGSGPHGRSPPYDAPKDPSRHSGFDQVTIAVEDLGGAVDDLDTTVARLRDADVRIRNDVLEFHDRRLVFVVGPGDLTIELAEWMGRRP